MHRKRKAISELYKNSGHPLRRYILRRLLLLIPVLFGVTLLTYSLMYLSPRGPVEMMLEAQGTAPDPELIADMKSRLGLDRPLLIQYFDWLGRFLCGDMGTSYIDGSSVAARLLKALPNTLILTALSMAVTIALSVPLGMLSAIKKGKITDRLICFFSFVGNSMPNFMVSLLLIYFFALKLGWFPVLSTSSPVSYVLPTLALAIPMTGKYIRQVRAAILEQLDRDYVRGACARGLRESVVLLRYVMPNAMMTLITLMTMSLGSLLGGTAVIEMIFSLPGMGYMMTNAVISRDYPVIQAFVVWMSLIYIVINLLTDIAYYHLDPRLCHETEVAK